MTEPAKEEKEADHHPYFRPKDAATLILVDRTFATPKVLVGKRHDKVVFMPGKFVFPGGRVDKYDNRVPVAAPIPRALEGGGRDPRGLRGNGPLSRSRQPRLGADVGRGLETLHGCRPVARSL